MQEPVRRARWRLKPLQVEGLAGDLRVPADGLVLGRDASCDVVLVGELYPIVSARHCRLAPEGDGLVLEDLGSTNGTWMGGEAVLRRAVTHGEVFQLGPAGPRFAVLSARIGGPVPPGAGSGLERTAFAKRDESRLGTLEEVRGELGLPPPLHSDALLVRPSGRWRMLAAAGAVLIAAALGLWLVREQTRAEALRVEAEEFARSLDQRVLASQGELERQREVWSTQRVDYERAQVAWEDSRAELVAERDRLVGRLEQLEVEGATAQDVEELESRLDAARLQLALYDPVELERTRVREIERVERAVVLIEAREVLVEPTSGRLLRVRAIAPGSRASSFHLEDEGEVFSRESTGSGVCISPEGHIVTNAHVVAGQSSLPAILMDGEQRLEARTELYIVFSGTGQRHLAQLVSLRRTDREDLALLKIEPFEAMPHVDGIDVNLPTPPRGTEVYALGFPLGKRVLQVGDTVIASAFRGIVSRTVDPYVQVDAAVHPGASGGPVIDNQGRIVGLVTAMQSADPRASSSQIGYMLPIERARSIWPPPR